MAFQHICLNLFFSSFATTIYSLFSFLFLVNSCLNVFIDMSFYRLAYCYFFTQLIFQYCTPSSVHFLEVAWFAAISLATNK